VSAHGTTGTAMGAPVTATPAPSNAPAAETALVNDGVSNDLSGLEVHSIEESPEAARTFVTPVYYRPSMFSNRPRKRWRWRVMRWAATILVVFAIVFFALLGEAVYINYFPTLAEQHLMLPTAPAPPRMPAPNEPVPIPADVTQPPPKPNELPVDADSPVPARR
jgi:hypothetical protein